MTTTETSQVLVRSALRRCGFCYGSGLAWQGNRAYRRGFKIGQKGAGQVEVPCLSCAGSGACGWGETLSRLWVVIKHKVRK